MKIVCVDPLLSGGKTCSYTVFDEKFSFLSHHISDISNPVCQQYLDTEKYIRVCYDVFKVFDVFSADCPFVHDVKILYDLAGKKFPSVIALGIEFLGHERMAKYAEYSEKVKAHIRSYQLAAIDVGKFGEQKLIPEELLRDLYRERACNIVALYKLLQDEDKIFYNKFYQNVKCLYALSREPLTVDTTFLDMSHFSELIRKHTKNNKLFLKFEPVGAKTGRLSFKKGTVNLYVLPKDLRKCIIARPGYSITQFDFKSFQPRLAIYATQDEAFKAKFKNVDDIYSVFEGDREENKLLFISWMFSHMRNEKFEREAYPIQKLRSELFDISQRNHKLTNMFGRVLHYHDEKDNVVFQNYITSLEADTVLSLMVYLHQKLAHFKSRIMFPFHDALVFEIADDESPLVDDIKAMICDWTTQVFGAPLPVESTTSLTF